MKSQEAGNNISVVEITNISAHGVWIYVNDAEHFLPYDEFPWFRDAQVKQILNVELQHGVHLHWPDLDVDLSVRSLENPDQYPMVAEG